jgi:hypothetical protein
MSACLLLRIGVGQIRIFSHRQFQMATVPQQGFSKAWRRRTEMPQDKECKRCKQCVRTSLFIELYYVILKIRMTLFPCFHLVSRTLKFSYQSIVFNYCTWKLGKILISWFITFWRELGVLAWLSSHPPRRPCRLKSGHTWPWDFSPFFSTSDGTFKNL